MKQCPTCKGRTRLRDELEQKALNKTVNEKGYLFERENLRTKQKNINKPEEEKIGYTDTLEECENCKRVMASIYNKNKNEHHHKCEYCKITSQAYPGTWTSDGLEETTPYEQLCKTNGINPFRNT